jgi:hypothetical protein
MNEDDFLSERQRAGLGKPSAVAQYRARDFQLDVLSKLEETGTAGSSTGAVEE